MTTWVLLRGLTRECDHWGVFPELLRQRLPPGGTVLALDLPGNGQLHRLRSPARIEDTLAQVRGQLLALALPPPWHLLAMSLGAMVAVEWARRHPHELAGAVLVNTSLRPLSPWYQRLRPSSYAALLRLLLAGQAPRARELAILRLTTRQPPDAATVLAAWSALRVARPVARVNAARQLLAAARYRAPVRAPAVPLLVLASRGDALVNPQCSRRLAAQWRTAFAEHPTAGHDLPLDDGPWLAEQVAQWLKGRCP